MHSGITSIHFGTIVLAIGIVQGCANSQNLLVGDKTSANSQYVLNAANGVVRSLDDCVRSSGWQDGVADGFGCAGTTAAPVEPAVVSVGSSLISYSGRAFFDFDSSELTVDGRQQLDQLTARLNAQDEISEIEVVGHADSVGTDQYNMALSEQRAETVKAHLQRSLDNVTVVTNGMGESDPVADNDTEEGRQRNRRVDVNIAALQQAQ